MITSIEREREREIFQSNSEILRGEDKKR